MKQSLAILFAVMLVSSPALSEIMVAESVEWMTNDSPLVVICKIQTAKDEGKFRNVTIAVKEVIKGDFKGDNLTFRIQMDRFEDFDWKDTQAEMLLFLSKAAVDKDGQALDGQWTLRSNSRTYGNPAIILSKPENIYSMDMKILAKSEDVLKAVREWARKPSPSNNSQPPNIFTVPRGSLLILIPFGNEIFRKVYAGSSCYLVVPAAEKFRKQAQDMAGSKQAETRARGALLLAYYPGEDSKQILRKLLEDKAEIYVPDVSGKVCKTVAEAAAATLDELQKQSTSQPVSMPSTASK